MVRERGQRKELVRIWYKLGGLQENVDIGV